MFFFIFLLILNLRLLVRVEKDGLRLKLELVGNLMVGILVNLLERNLLKLVG